MSDITIDEKSEDRLWLEYKKTHDPSIREAFIKQYAPLVRYVAGKVASGMPNSVEFEDLVGFGVFGLIDAIEKFAPEKGVRFKTYAVTRIHGAIYDELRSLDWVPRSVRQKSREIEEVIHKLEAQLGRTVSDKEIAADLGISLEEYHNVALKISGSSILSLNDIWYTSDDNDSISIIESIEAPSSLQPDTVIEKAEVKRIIIDAINTLPDKEKKVLILYYYENLTLKEIGHVLAVTESRVSQLHTKAILRLRAKLTHIKKGVF